MPGRTPAGGSDGQKQDAEQLKSKRAAARTSATERVAAWRGAAPERDTAKLTEADKEAAAAVYLRLVRQLEGTRGETLLGLARLLRVQRLSLVGGGKETPPKLKLADTARRPTRSPLPPPDSITPPVPPPASRLTPPASPLPPSIFASSRAS